MVARAGDLNWVIDGMFDYSKFASQEGRYELMKFDMLGKFKRTRYNNYKYKIVMA
jgi:hypothetical protein